MATARPHLSAARSISVLVDTEMMMARFERGDCTHQGLRQPVIGGSHVAERPVKAHVRDPMPSRIGDASERPELIDHVMRQFVRIGLDRPAAETHQVRESDVRTQVDTVRECKPHGLVHDDRIAGVIAAGHVG